MTDPNITPRLRLVNLPNFPKRNVFKWHASRISQLSGLTAKSFEQLLLAAINLLKSNWMTSMEIR